MSMFFILFTFCSLQIYIIISFNKYITLKNKAGCQQGMLHITPYCLQESIQCREHRPSFFPDVRFLRFCRKPTVLKMIN